MMPGPLSEFGESRVEEIGREANEDGVVVSRMASELVLLTEFVGGLLFYFAILYWVLLGFGIFLQWGVEIQHVGQAIVYTAGGSMLMRLARWKQRAWGME